MTEILYGPRHNRFPVREYDWLAKCGTEAGARAHWRRGETACEACRSAANRMREDRLRRYRERGLPPGDPRHGLRGYNAYGCLCDICTTAGRAYQKTKYRRRVDRER